jgi:hypothetical protein
MISELGQKIILGCKVSGLASAITCAVLGCTSKPSVPPPSREEVAGQLQSVQEAWTALDSALARRMDVASNVIASLKRPGFEPPSLAPVIEAWSSVSLLRRETLGVPDQSKMTARIKSEKQLADALEQLITVANSDPHFPNSGAVQFLSTMLNKTTAEIDSARTSYNAAAQKYISLLAASHPQAARSIAPPFRSTLP